MIQPTRTNLLYLKDRARAVANSIEILRTKRQALIVEFLRSSRPFLRSRQEIRGMYGRALEELSLSLGHEGREAVESIAMSAEREHGVEITEEKLWGLKYKDVKAAGSPLRSPPERNYDWRKSTHHMEECIHLFERVVDSVVKIAAFESKLKRFSEEITKTTRRTRVLEERVRPRLRYEIRYITHYIEEREREAYYRLKRVKSGRAAQRRVALLQLDESVGVPGGI